MTICKTCGYETRTYPPPWEVRIKELETERDNLLERNKELLKAEHDLSDAYLRIRELVSAWETPFAPTTVDVWELTESKVRSLQERNKILESSNTTQEMLDDVKNIYEGALTALSSCQKERDDVKKLFEETKLDLLLARKEIEVDNKLLEGRDELLESLPQCPQHGKGCIPHAIEWIKAQRIISGKRK